MQGNPVYKFFSALLCYPEAELVEALPEFQAALDQMPELAAHCEGLQALLDYLGGNSLRHIQEEYVSTFDRNRLHALYIFEHIFGEDRDRGSAMVDLLEEYRKYGFELGDDELPDFLPALLEFFAHIPPADAQKLLGDQPYRQKLAHRRFALCRRAGEHRGAQPCRAAAPNRAARARYGRSHGNLRPRRIRYRAPAQAEHPNRTILSKKQVSIPAWEF